MCKFCKVNQILIIIVRHNLINYCSSVWTLGSAGIWHKSSWSILPATYRFFWLFSNPIFQAWINPSLTSKVKKRPYNCCLKKTLSIGSDRIGSFNLREVSAQMRTEIGHGLPRKILIIHQLHNERGAREMNNPPKRSRFLPGVWMIVYNGT